jgi:hypothetical protein
MIHAVHVVPDAMLHARHLTGGTLLAMAATRHK